MSVGVKNLKSSLNILLKLCEQFREILDISFVLHKGLTAVPRSNAAWKVVTVFVPVR